MDGADQKRKIKTGEDGQQKLKRERKTNAKKLKADGVEWEWKWKHARNKNRKKNRGGEKIKTVEKREIKTDE